MEQILLAQIQVSQVSQVLQYFWLIILTPKPQRDMSALTKLLHLYCRMCDRKTMVVYHLQKKSGNFGWNVNGKTNLAFPNGKFPWKTGFLER